MSLLALHPDDDVAVALTDQSNGVAAGHKVARRAVAAGQPVRKYGQVIGRAAVGIEPGDWVHSHNLIMSDDARHADIGAGVRAVTPADPQATFQGYARADGTGGVRNHVLVLTSVNCSATVARRIADGFRMKACRRVSMASWPSPIRAAAAGRRWAGTWSCCSGRWRAMRGIRTSRAC